VGIADRLHSTHPFAPVEEAEETVGSV